MLNIIFSVLSILLLVISVIFINYYQFIIKDKNIQCLNKINLLLLRYKPLTKIFIISIFASFLWVMVQNKLNFPDIVIKIILSLVIISFIGLLYEMEIDRIDTSELIDKIYKNSKYF